MTQKRGEAPEIVGESWQRIDGDDREQPTSREAQKARSSDGKRRILITPHANGADYHTPVVTRCNDYFAH